MTIDINAETIKVFGRELMRDVGIGGGVRWYAEIGEGVYAFVWPPESWHRPRWSATIVHGTFADESDEAFGESPEEAINALGSLCGPDDLERLAAAFGGAR